MDALADILSSRVNFANVFHIFSGLPAEAGLPTDSILAFEQRPTQFSRSFSSCAA
jgi:hypothetical protein